MDDKPVHPIDQAIYDSRAPRVAEVTTMLDKLRAKL